MYTHAREGQKARGKKEERRNTEGRSEGCYLWRDVFRLNRCGMNTKLMEDQLHFIRNLLCSAQYDRHTTSKHRNKDSNSSINSTRISTQEDIRYGTELQNSVFVCVRASVCMIEKEKEDEQTKEGKKERTDQKDR